MPDRLLKFEATGNDFLVVDSDSPLATSWWVQRLCNRRTGVGADGMLVVTMLDAKTAQMVILNADGSRPEMCGNGVRCVASYLKERYNADFPITVISDAGPRHVDLAQSEETFTVEMGVPRIKANPTLVTYKSHEVVLYEVNMGNPHAVCFQDQFFNTQDLWDLGKLLNQGHEAFPEGVNLEVVDLRQGDNPLICRVFERGVGETHACGTGACAVAVAAQVNQLTQKERVEVELPGGTLVIDWQKGDNHQVHMSGLANFVGEFRVSGAWLRRCEEQR